MKLRSLILLLMLTALALLAPSLRAQDGLDGAIARLKSIPDFLHDPFEQRLAAADFDNDRRPDGAVLLDSRPFNGQRSFRIELHVSSSKNINLTFESIDPALAISALDVNNDGAPDIIVEQQFTHKRLHIWLNNGHGSFSKVRIEDYPSHESESPYQIQSPTATQSDAALCLPTKSGSESIAEKAAVPSIKDFSTGRGRLKPIMRATQAWAEAPNPTRGPPSPLFQ